MTPTGEPKMGKKKIAEIVKRFQRKMQKIVDNDGGITEITIQAGDKPPVIIASKKQKKDEQ